ncbi:hypothetical protein NHX12_010755, partial [Muraenolepis orangiensis]
MVLERYLSGIVRDGGRGTGWKQYPIQFQTQTVICVSGRVCWNQAFSQGPRKPSLVLVVAGVRRGGLPVHSQGDSQSDNKVMDNITVRQGETVFLRCAQGDIVTHTAWLNRSSILYAGEDKWSVDPRVSLVTLNQEEFTIKIENVDMTDEGQILAKENIHKYVPPKIINLSRDLVVNEGSNVTLLCQASGKPEPSISWKLISPS